MANLTGYLQDKNGNRLYSDDYDTGWIKVTEFFNGAGHYNETGAPVCYRRIGKIVYLNGLLRSGSPGKQFQLPSGFIPKGVYRAYITRKATSTCRIFVNYTYQNGEVNIEDTEAGLEISLAPVTFIADA